MKFRIVKTAETGKVLKIIDTDLESPLSAALTLDVRRQTVDDNLIAQRWDDELGRWLKSDPFNHVPFGDQIRKEMGL